MSINMNISEQEFYDFMNDFEISSMVKGVKSQVYKKFGNRQRRVDFVLTLLNGLEIFIETDGNYHDKEDVVSLDKSKDSYSSGFGTPTIRIKFRDFYNDKFQIANKIEGMIDLLNSE